MRDGGSLIAFRVGTAPLADAGLRMVGTHTDSPTFKVRPRYDVLRGRYRLVGVEPYGGLLAHTWLDRELTVAGRLAVRGTPDPVLVRLPGGPVRLPSLAIHLDRQVREGLKLDPQTQLVPVWGASDSDGDGLLAMLAEAAGVDEADVVGHDLVLADSQPCAATGADGDWVAAPRLDNQGSCHSAVLALLAAAPAAHTQLLVANDHEEVGSGSMEGAQGLVPPGRRRPARRGDRRHRPAGPARRARPHEARRRRHGARAAPDAGRAARALARARARRRPGAQAERQPELRHRRPQRWLVRRALRRRGRAAAGLRHPRRPALRLAPSGR